MSMGANAATKLYRVIENVERILSIELINAAQALEIRKHRSSTFIENIVKKYREKVDFLEKDRVLYTDIEKSIEFLKSLKISE